MKITNFNSCKHLWHVWNKMYCHDLERKITSCFNYMFSFDPDYYILNDPNRAGSMNEEDLTGNQFLVIEEDQSLVDKENQYIFNPWALQWRTGFYNPYSNGYYFRAPLWSHTYYPDETEEAKSSGIVEWYPDYVVNTDTKEYLWAPAEQYAGCTEGSIELMRDFEDLQWILAKSGNTWEWKNKDQVGNNGDGTISTDSTWQDAFLFFKQTPLPFPTGYCCIRNKVSSIATIQDLLFVPVGNGGFFNLQVSQGSDLLVSYKANDLNDFSNKITFSLDTNLRYILFAQEKYLTASKGFLNQQSSDNTILIGDKDSRLWSGSPDVACCLYHTDAETTLGEEIFADVKYSHQNKIINNANYYTFHIETPPGESYFPNNFAFIDLF